MQTKLQKKATKVYRNQKNDGELEKLNKKSCKGCVKDRCKVFEKVPEVEKRI